MRRECKGSATGPREIRRQVVENVFPWGMVVVFKSDAGVRSVWEGDRAEWWRRGDDWWSQIRQRLRETIPVGLGSLAKRFCKEYSQF